MKYDEVKKMTAEELAVELDRLATIPIQEIVIAGTER